MDNNSMTSIINSISEKIFTNHLELKAMLKNTAYILLEISEEREIILYSDGSFEIIASSDTLQNFSISINEVPVSFNIKNASYFSSAKGLQTLKISPKGEGLCEAFITLNGASLRLR